MSFQIVTWRHLYNRIVRHSDITWAPWCINSPTSRQCAQQRVCVNNKQLQVPIAYRFEGNLTVIGREPSQRACNAVSVSTVYPKKYAHGFCFAVLCCGYTLTDFPIYTRLPSLALWQSNDCPSAGKATLMNMDKYFMWNHYERLHNHNKAKHNKTVCIFIGIYCTSWHIHVMPDNSIDLSST